MVKVIYVYEKIKHDRLKKCGWSYRQLKYRIDFKTKKKSYFYEYKGFCQFNSVEQWDNDCYVEQIHIYGYYKHYQTKIENSEYKKDVRNADYEREGWVFSELMKK